MAAFAIPCAPYIIGGLLGLTGPLAIVLGPLFTFVNVVTVSCRIIIIFCAEQTDMRPPFPSHAFPCRLISFVWKHFLQALLDPEGRLLMDKIFGVVVVYKDDD